MKFYRRIASIFKHGDVGIIEVARDLVSLKIKCQQHTSKFNPVACSEVAIVSLSSLRDLARKANVELEEVEGIKPGSGGKS